MSHPRDLLSALIDGELTPSEAAHVEAHLEECATCRGDRDGLRRTRDAVRSLPPLEPPVPLLAPLRRRPPWMWAAASAAAAALAIGLAVAPQKTEVFDLDTLAGQHSVRVVVDPGLSAIRGSVGSP